MTLTRQYVGLAFLAAALASLGVLAIRRRKRWTAVFLLAFLIGYGSMGFTMDSLRTMRDSALHVTMAPRSPDQHGIWFSLLGETGTLGPTAIGLTYRDDVIFAVLEREAPGFAPIELHEVARQVFLRYIWEHPHEFAVVLVSKVVVVMHVIAQRLASGGIGSFAMLVSIVAALVLVDRWPLSPRQRKRSELPGSLRAEMSCPLWYGLAITAVPVLTSPGHAFELVVLWFGILTVITFLAAYGFLSELVQRGAFTWPRPITQVQR